MRNRRPAGEDRGHHISHIAHHFLGDGAPASPDMAPVCFVAGPGSSHALARDLARSWVRTGDRDVTLVDGFEAVVADAASRVRAARPEEEIPDHEPVCWHLGPMTSPSLDDLAAVGRVPGGRLPGHGRPGRLLWVLEEADLARWGHLLRLGRLVSSLCPAAVTLLVDGGGAAPKVASARRLLERRAEQAVGATVAVAMLPAVDLPGVRAAALDALPPWWDARNAPS